MPLTTYLNWSFSQELVEMQRPCLTPDLNQSFEELSLKAKKRSAIVESSAQTLMSIQILDSRAPGQAIEFL